jgi:hypothetical protein
MPSNDPTDGPTRLDLLKFSYGEILDATKHQDDKIGRILGAVAFFTGGALAFVDRELLQARYQIGDSSVPLVATSLAVFLILTSLSVLEYLLALVAPLISPPRHKGPAKGVTSHIFFSTISEVAAEEWKQDWLRSEVKLAWDFERDLVSETMNLATRAKRKYDHAQAAAALFFCAAPFYALTIIASIDASLNSAPTEIDWNLRRRLVAGAMLGGVALALTLVAGRTHGIPRPLLAMPVLVAALVVVPGGLIGLIMLAIVGATAAVGLVRLARLNSPRDERPNASVHFCRRLAPVIAGTILLTVVGCVLQALHRPAWCLVCAGICLPLMQTEALRHLLPEFAKSKD